MNIDIPDVDRMVNTLCHHSAVNSLLMALGYHAQLVRVKVRVENNAIPTASPTLSEPSAMVK
jgi:hypothetical protein